ncbi:hypothetical protein QY97_02924 [Bacillus thermotolerans]|uniref:Uncharacterized protein n=1 Tax=Bacillus thermotolerans TaxID=1221996 RepID=A0A0F5HQ33_BACTR|nr:hypothetical protein QY97_02924 [Bacillus thermotolerans]KKB35368.1 hypothetical protein QY95_03502 [Bacillus thermotolerans]
MSSGRLKGALIRKKWMASHIVKVTSINEITPNNMPPIASMSEPFCENRGLKPRKF